MRKHHKPEPGRRKLGLTFALQVVEATLGRLIAYVILKHLH